MRQYLALVLSLGFCGCAGTGGGSAKPVLPTTTTVQVTKPVIQAASGTEYSKVVDGVSITVTPTAFNERELVRRTMQEKPSMITMNDQVTWKVTDTPVVVYEPQGVELTLKITNSLDHVLRLAGSVVTLNVDAKPQSTAGLDELSRVVLIPNQSWEGKLVGPANSMLPDQCAVVFSIYDVVTAVDAANNPTKRTNFEWVFAYTKTREGRQMAVKTYEKKMTRSEALEFGRGGSLVSQ
jgi:hypothetical protein